MRVKRIGYVGTRTDEVDRMRHPPRVARPLRTARLAPASTASPAAPRYARPFVAVFLAALVVCPLAGWNLWPFSAWALFSRLRTDRQTAWAAVAVDSAGRARPYRIASLAHGFEGFRVLAPGLAGRSVVDRDAICTAWLRGAVDRFGPGTRLVRIYRLEWRLSDRRGGREPPIQRTLVWTCTVKGARAPA